MNKSFLVLCGCFLLVSACKEPVIDEGVLPFSEPATVDADGGNWRTIVLKSTSDISVPQPAAVTSDTYKSELAQVKNGVFSLEPEKITAINYWAVGGVKRWNQIARQLVAKYNTESGNPLNATNSSASAPFAARLYAALSVAQYDALVVAWKAKYQYNRASLVDQGVTTRLPVANVPSYPSEDAVIAEVSCQMLAYFFPDETTWLKTKAAEHKQSRIWNGANVPSDIKAGEDIGTAMTAKLVERLKSDRFSAAGDPTNSWTTGLAKAPYDVKWTSLLIPARPPLLPLAGKVKTWFDSTTIAKSLPASPPATTSTTFQTDLSEVRTIASARTRDQSRIAAKWDDGAGTYTIPGHWNQLTEDYILQYRQNELRAARTYALVNRALQDGGTACWTTKYTYFTPRPSQIDPTIRTATLIPNTPGYTAEHATFASAATTVLLYLFPDETTELNAQLAEATLSELYGGTSFRFDNQQGAKLGAAVGTIAVESAKADGSK
ncbi:phosphatase PAP2 family protein [Spirosoma agri]|uniref:PA-phosphatase n=1 Tax=Spirosoma agri TaxID=1987381 RepID=A0A6M0IEQ0_9BACT|nr:PA-phosphatase [Spirosoma agri]NEU66618.1 PA-phosphatase [Spirosoma agri]